LKYGGEVPKIKALTPWEIRMDVSKAKPQQVQQAQAAKHTQEARQTQQREAQAKAYSEPKKTEEPKRQPVVNSQGQTTGRLLNVTA
jgi:sorbitol-specific phosphotransferase system component IIBC